MATEQEKKEFALSQLAPYFADPTTCAINLTTNDCYYHMEDGRMCVVGKNMLNPESFGDCGILTILVNNYDDQKRIFKPESVDILTTKEWDEMQAIHDEIAMAFYGNKEYIRLRVEALNLFTYDELVERAETLKKVSS